MRRRIFLVVVTLALAACGGEDAGGGGEAAFAAVSEQEARAAADKRAKEAAKEDGTPLALAEFKRDRTPQGKDAWLAVYADSTGEFDDLCIWVNDDGTDATDCPGYAGVSHATARIEAHQEAERRERDLDTELEFVELRHGKGEQDKPAWEAQFDASGSDPDLCVWIQTDPDDKRKNLISSDECP